MNQQMDDMEYRLTRMESRLVQLMHFLGMNPYERYDYRDTCDNPGYSIRAGKSTERSIAGG